MIRTLLVGLDPSPFADRAVELGIGWARRFQAMLVGIGIVDEPRICRAEMVPLGAGAFKEHSDQVRLERETRTVELMIERFSIRCSEAGITSKTLQSTGDPAEAILREAVRFDAILLGRQTSFHFATQDGPCETLNHVARNMPRPVIAVPDVLPPGNAVVVAYDGSLQSARVLSLFQASGLGDQVPVHVVSVQSHFDEASRQANRAVEFLGSHDIHATAHAIATDDDPATILLDRLQAFDAGLLVMGAYGQSTIREFFLGSVTRTLLRSSPVPLFLYH